MKALSLFSGIGGFDLAATWAGIEVAAFCEIEPFCRAVLKKHWPEVPCFDDIRTTTAGTLRARGIDDIGIIYGGPPCQPASLAGQRKGEDDSRWLWGDFLRLVSDVRPVWVLAENPPGICSLPGKNLDWILDELEATGYEVQAFLVSAANVGAPHLRERVWIVANAASAQLERNKSGVLRVVRERETFRYSDGQACAVLARPTGKVSKMAYSENPDRRRADAAIDTRRRDTQIRRCSQPSGRIPDWRTEPDVGRVAYGIPRRVDRLRGLGNAIVPQDAYLFLQSIVDMENAQ